MSDTADPNCTAMMPARRGRGSFVADCRGTFAPVDGSINEVYAFHGTQVRYALAIAENVAELQRPLRSCS